MISITLQQLRLLRIRAQHLEPATAEQSTAQLVRKLCGIQAQELPSATLAIKARSDGLVVEDVKKAREDDRSIVLTWCMRGTMHLVPAEDISWMISFFGPLVIQGHQRRYAELGLDEETRRKAIRLIRNTLSSHDSLTRAELAVALGREGLPVEGQAIAHLVGAAALEGVICFGPERDGLRADQALTYVLLEDWLKVKDQREINADRIIEELTRRYLEAYGPATPYDLANWAGFSIGQAKAGFESIASDLISCRLQTQGGESSAWMLKSQAGWLDDLPGEPIVRLLPRYDTYLLGYQSRAFMVAPAYANRIHPGGGLIRQCLIVDGQAVGTWQVKRKKDQSTIVLDPFQPLEPGTVEKIKLEVQDIGRFLGKIFVLN